MKQQSREDAVRAAVSRLVERRPLVAPDSRLIDSNLIAEAGVSKATFYRMSAVTDLWRQAKVRSVRAAIAQLKEQASIDRDVVLTDALLLETAGVDHAALNRMDDQVLAEWHQLRDRNAILSKSPSRAAIATIEQLTSIIMALDLAVQERDKIIDGYRAKESARSKRKTR